MDVYEDPAAARWRLQRELKRLRSEASLTQRDVANEMEWSPSKVIRIESGGVAVTTNDLKQLLVLYGVKDQAVVDELLDTNRESRRPSWADFRDVLTPEARTYWGYEASAVIIRQFENTLVPGLLQTQEYTKALLSGIAVPGLDDRVIERIVEARASRQTLLEREVLPQLFFVVDEAVLRRQVGGPRVMRHQLDRIRELAEYEQIVVQVVQNRAGAYPGQLGSWVLYEFRDQDTALMIETRAGIEVHDDVDEIGLFLDLFQDLERRVASRPEDLGQILDKIRSEMSEGSS